MSSFLDDLKRTVKRLTGSEESAPPRPADRQPSTTEDDTDEDAGEQSVPIDTELSTQPERRDPQGEPQVRTVYCVKLKRELPGLEEPPFPGELGERIYENVSRQAYDMWIEQSTIIINHYGLSLGDPDARQFLQEQMELFLFQDHEEHTPDDWIPEDEESAGAPVPGPQGKGGGAPAPQGKGGGAPGPQGKGGGAPGPMGKA